MTATRLLIRADIEKKIMEKDLNFYEPNLEGTDCSKLNLTGAIMISANLKGTKFVSTILKSSKLSKADASGADFSGGDLSGNGKLNDPGRYSDLSNLIFDDKTTFSATTQIQFSKINDRKLLDKLISSGIKNFTGCEIEADLENFKGSGLDLTRANLKAKNLKGSHFVGSICSGSNLSESDARGADFSDTDLSGDGFVGNQLGTRTDLTDLIIDSKTKFSDKTKVQYSIIKNRELLEKLLESGVRDFTGCEIAVDLTGLNLSDTVLCDIDLSSSLTTKVDFRRSTISTKREFKGSSFGNQLPGVQMQGAKLDHRSFFNFLNGGVSDFSDCDLSVDDSMKGTSAYQSRSEDYKNRGSLNFTGVNFQNVNFTKAFALDIDWTTQPKLENTKIKGATLSNEAAKAFLKANVRDLTNCNLKNVDLSGITLTGLKLSGAIIDGVNFLNTTMIDVDFDGVKATPQKLAALFKNKQVSIDKATMLSLYRAGLREFDDFILPEGVKPYLPVIRESTNDVDLCVKLLRQYVTDRNQPSFLKFFSSDKTEYLDQNDVSAVSELLSMYNEPGSSFPDANSIYSFLKIKDVIVKERYPKLYDIVAFCNPLLDLATQLAKHLVTSKIRFENFINMHDTLTVMSEQLTNNNEYSEEEIGAKCKSFCSLIASKESLNKEYCLSLQKAIDLPIKKMLQVFSHSLSNLKIECLIKHKQKLVDLHLDSDSVVMSLLEKLELTISKIGPFASCTSITVYKEACLVFDDFQSQLNKFKLDTPTDIEVVKLLDNLKIELERLQPRRKVIASCRLHPSSSSSVSSSNPSFSTSTNTLSS